VGNKKFPLEVFPQNAIINNKSKYRRKHMAVQEKNLKLDSKRRITIGKLASDDITSYDAKLQEDGTILLIPKVEIPAHEAWLYRNPKALTSVLEGIEDSKAGRVSELEEDFWEGIEND
jgi:hypothetical protein